MKSVKVMFLVSAFIAIFIPIMLSAQILSPEDICKQAEMDAHKDVNGILWFIEGTEAGIPNSVFLLYISQSPWYIIGGLIGFFGWPVLPMIIVPNPPPIRYIGVPPDYITLYTKCYKEEKKKLQLINASIGCAIGTGIWLIIFD